jgi:hypothetical protein
MISSLPKPCNVLPIYCSFVEGERISNFDKGQGETRISCLLLGQGEWSRAVSIHGAIPPFLIVGKLRDRHAARLDPLAMIAPFDN